eukprot:SAG11_NODE_10182_length_849_cov_0.966667_1_plen_260_part_01
MVEGHSVFVSEDFRKLSTCVQAAGSLLYPFTWQHIFVPILPRTWIDYIAAPMPFVCGVHASMFDDVLEQPIEESMLFAQLDTGDIMQAGDAEGTMPTAAGARLEKAWSKLVADLSKQKISPKEFNASVRDAAIDFMCTVVGNYRMFVSDDEEGNYELDAEEMLSSIQDESVAEFVRGLQGTQMFEIWCRQRVALAKDGYPQKGMFESRISSQTPSLIGTAPISSDVTTARTLVSISRNLRDADADGDTVVTSIREHSILK